VTGDGLKQAAMSGARWTLAARLGLQLFTWPITIIVMRLLDPRDYGLFAVAMVVNGFVTLFSEFGLGAALVQAERVDRAVERSACTAIVALNLFIALVLVLLAPWVAMWAEEPDLTLIIRVLALDLLITSIATVPQALMERQLMFRRLSIAMMSGGAGGSVVTLLCAWLDFGVWSLVAGSLTIGLVRSAMLLIMHRRVVWPSATLRPVRPLLHFSSHVILGRALWYWYGQSDQLILARLLRASSLGLYNVASQLAMLPVGKAMEAINRVAFPVLSRLRTDADGMQRTHQRLLALVATYAFGICWGLGAVAEDFVVLVLGEKWHSAALPLALLALVAPLRMFCSLHNTITTAAGKPQAANKELATASVVIPLAILAGGWNGGAGGAAIAWVIAYPFIYLLSNALTCSAIGVSAWRGLRAIAAPLAAGLVMLLVVSWVQASLDESTSTAWRLAAGCISGAAGFSAALWLASPALVRDARSLLQELVRPPRPAE